MSIFDIHLEVASVDKDCKEQARKLVDQIKTLVANSKMQHNFLTMEMDKKSIELTKEAEDRNIEQDRRRKLHEAEEEAIRLKNKLSQTLDNIDKLSK